MNGTTNGYAAIKVANSVTTFEAWGLGSYCYFNVNPAVVSGQSLRGTTGRGREVAQPVHGFTGRPWSHHQRHQHHGSNHTHQHHAGYGDHLPVTTRLRQ